MFTLASTHILFAKICSSQSYDNELVKYCIHVIFEILFFLASSAHIDYAIHRHTV